MWRLATYYIKKGVSFNFKESVYYGLHYLIMMKLYISNKKVGNLESNLFVWTWQTWEDFGRWEI